MVSNLLARLAKQHSQCIQALKSFNINCNESITWDFLEKRITPTQITLIEKMDLPQLLLIPNLRYYQISDKINPYKTPRRELSEAEELERLDKFGRDLTILYNGGITDMDYGWGVTVVDLGRQDLSSLNITYPIKPAEYISKVVEFYRTKGLQVLTGARSYFALIILKLFLQESIDVDQEIVLNPESVAKDPTSTISAGSWYDSLVHLHLYDPETPWSVLYVYPEVRLV